MHLVLWYCLRVAGKPSSLYKNSPATIPEGSFLDSFGDSANLEWIQRRRIVKQNGIKVASLVLAFMGIIWMPPGQYANRYKRIKVCDDRSGDIRPIGLDVLRGEDQPERLREDATGHRGLEKNLTHDDRQRQEVWSAHHENDATFFCIVQNVSRCQQLARWLRVTDRWSYGQRTVQFTGATTELEVEFPVGFRRAFLPRKDATKSGKLLRIRGGPGWGSASRVAMAKNSFGERSVDVKQRSNDTCSQAMRTMFNVRRLQRRRQRLGTATKPTHTTSANVRLMIAILRDIDAGGGWGSWPPENM